jgi:hypothetical protein
MNVVSVEVIAMAEIPMKRYSFPLGKNEINIYTVFKNLQTKPDSWKLYYYAVRTPPWEWML